MVEGDDDLGASSLVSSPPQRNAVLVRLKAMPGRFRWTAELVALLGKVADREVARRAGVCPQTVVRERKRRNIETPHPHREAIEWTAEMVAVLGTASDLEVAGLLGIPRHCVMDRRRRDGIRAFRPSGRRQERSLPWAAQDLALLGQASDRDLAAQLGISTSTVQRKRRRLGLASFGSPPTRLEWSEEPLSLLGKVPDVELARCYAISSTAVKAERSRRGIAALRDHRPFEATPELVELLHKPSSEVRRQTGLDFHTTRRLRRRLGIAALTVRQWRWSPEILARLGKEFDRCVAEDLGVSTKRVAATRKELGIESFCSWRCRQRQKAADFGRSPER